MDNSKDTFDSNSLKICGFCKKSQRFKTREDLQSHIAECQDLYEKFESGINKLIQNTDPDKMCILIFPGYVSFVRGSDAHATLVTLLNPKSWSILRKKTSGSSICLVPIDEETIVVI